MDWPLRKIACKQLTNKLQPIASLLTPVNGWVNTIRNILGMSSSQLAKRCMLSKQRILRIEADEIRKKVTLETLEKIAEGLNCRLVYALVPKQDLASIIENQATKKATQNLNHVSYSMSLEDQKVSGEDNKFQLELLTKLLLEKNIKSIWD